MRIRLCQIVTCYNQRESLPRVLESILGQSVLPDRVLIGDDASTDGSQDVIRDYAGRYPDLIMTILGEANLGIAANFNRCIAAADADLVSLVAADDELLPGRFEAQSLCIEDHWPHSGVFYSDSRVHYEVSDKTVEWSNGGRQGRVFAELARRRFHMRNFWFGQNLWKAVGGFDETLPLYEDWKFKMELALRTPFTFCPGTFSVYHVDGTGSSSKPHAEHLEAVRRITRELEGRRGLLPGERRALRGVRRYYETMAKDGMLAKLPLVLGTLLEDPSWAGEYLATFIRTLKRRTGSSDES